MEIELAVKRLSALAQDTRLQIFRRLVRKGPDGMAAGDLARALNIPANTLSAHLLILSNAALVGARREGRSIIYSVKFDAMRELLVYLTKDCCEGRPEVCAPLGEALSSAACCEPKKVNRHEAPARTRRR
jgi:DNA-binding transcriptional ArsR family regulator